MTKKRPESALFQYRCTKIVESLNGEGKRQSQIARDLGIPLGSITALIKHLVRDNRVVVDEEGLCKVPTEKPDYVEALQIVPSKEPRKKVQKNLENLLLQILELVEEAYDYAKELDKQHNDLKVRIDSLRTTLS